uniref:WD40 repeat domain-containing protein n=1 Tax=Desertifilum tharense IPPAS B-1220 TaxID=1781255 RepID=A0ACD5H4T5_9CYAN
MGWRRSHPQTLAASRVWRICAAANAPDHEGRIWDVAFSPDGQRIATASLDGTAKLWRWQQPNSLAETPDIVLEGHTSEIWGIAFSPDNQKIATAGREGSCGCGIPKVNCCGL